MDVYDRIMNLPGLRVFNPVYKKYKEGLLYLFFGFLTFAVSIGTYAIFSVMLSINELIANVFSWILAVFFAFFTNQKWVFKCKANSIREFFKQMRSFFTGRVITLIIEEIILFTFITCMDFNHMIVKLIAQVVIIILNYVISKLLVFR
jgi:putative flippase GtrA